MSLLTGLLDRLRLHVAETTQILDEGARIQEELARVAGRPASDPERAEVVARLAGFQRKALEFLTRTPLIAP